MFCLTTTTSFNINLINMQKFHLDKKLHFIETLISPYEFLNPVHPLRESSGWVPLSGILGNRSV
jgi:hypothetical protein